MPGFFESSCLFCIYNEFVFAAYYGSLFATVAQGGTTGTAIVRPLFSFLTVRQVKTRTLFARIHCGSQNSSDITKEPRRSGPGCLSWVSIPGCRVLLLRHARSGFLQVSSSESDHGTVVARSLHGRGSDM